MLWIEPACKCLKGRLNIFTIFHFLKKRWVVQCSFSFLTFWLQVQQITDENVCSEYWFMEVFAIDIQYYMWASLTNTRHVIFICKARGLIPLELVEGWMPPPHLSHSPDPPRKNCLMYLCWNFIFWYWEIYGTRSFHIPFWLNLTPLPFQHQPLLTYKIGLIKNRCYFLILEKNYPSCWKNFPLSSWNNWQT